MVNQRTQVVKSDNKAKDLLKLKKFGEAQVTSG